MLNINIDTDSNDSKRPNHKSPSSSSDNPDVNSFLKFSIQNILQQRAAAANAAAAKSVAKEEKSEDEEEDEEDANKEQKVEQAALPIW